MAQKIREALGTTYGGVQSKKETSLALYLRLTQMGCEFCVSAADVMAGTGPEPLDFNLDGSWHGFVTLASKTCVDEGLETIGDVYKHAVEMGNEEGLTVYEGSRELPFLLMHDLAREVRRPRDETWVCLIRNPCSNAGYDLAMITWNDIDDPCCPCKIEVLTSKVEKMSLLHIALINCTLVLSVVKN